MKFRRQAQRDTATPLAPLLDVVLLLLIFFVVTTSFAENQLALDLPGADAGSPGEEDPLLIEIDPEGVMSIAGERIETAMLSERLLSAREGQRAVELRADRASEHGAVVTVLELANEAGVESVGIAVSSGRASSASGTADEPRPSRPPTAAPPR